MAVLSKQPEEGNLSPAWAISYPYMHSALTMNSNTGKGGLYCLQLTSATFETVGTEWWHVRIHVNQRDLIIQLSLLMKKEGLRKDM